MTDKTTFCAECPECVGERNCIVIGETERSWDSGDRRNSVQWGTVYRLLQCKGCDTVFYHSKSWDSEDFDYDYDDEGQTVITSNYRYETYPRSLEHRPQWIEDIAAIDYQLYLLLNEVYQAYNNESYILASIGLRTAFDRTSQVLNILPTLSLGKKVEKLAEDGYIGETEKSQLLIVTNAGNAAAHRAWSPTKSEFKSLLTITEDFIRRSVLRDDSIIKIAGKIPSKQKKPNEKDTNATNTLPEILAQSFKIGE
ncbi:DUF4145 domain-containing protein [Erwinia persicina]|uniref:DUF4145 domain-containing protein n=1 Tax=Erwinia persicina TaxID=55211 RepID=A0A4U3FIJ4_9GAMM|nr:DUF4145 domain-containing protein [Erwinia persicina]MBD8107909.1 DUF4145 domain-containing protein [Erwinia persicina]MBD8210989.1 DUF4145 domain-containing protein [Erwinia persicina]TKJ92499.1 hypothetical protein EpCFBP13511_06755 [Erwinia persicina]